LLPVGGLAYSVAICAGAALSMGLSSQASSQLSPSRVWASINSEGVPNLATNRRTLPSKRNKVSKLASQIRVAFSRIDWKTCSSSPTSDVAACCSNAWCVGALDAVAVSRASCRSRRYAEQRWHPAASHGDQTRRHQAPSGSRASGPAGPSRQSFSRGRPPRTSRGQAPQPDQDVHDGRLQSGWRTSWGSESVQGCVGVLRAFAKRTEV